MTRERDISNRPFVIHQKPPVQRVVLVSNYSTGLCKLPIFSMVQVTSCPFFKNFGGSKPAPTPAGVPVAIISPASSVIPSESSWIICSMPVIICVVLPLCLFSPSTLQVSSSSTGNSNSSTVTMQGPIAVR